MPGLDFVKKNWTNNAALLGFCVLGVSFLKCGAWFSNLLLNCSNGNKLVSEGASN